MVTDRMSRVFFSWVHKHNLIYNACWEDPRIDHEALELTDSDNILMIASAGCNALDYALKGPNRVYAVDVNPYQTALLELKQAGIRGLDFEQFFDLFGRGRIDNWKTVYKQQLRDHLSDESQKIWDNEGKMFSGRGRRNSFYFRGSVGLFAWMANGYINRICRLRNSVNELLETTTLSEQQEVFYSQQVDERLWKPILVWFLRRDATMATLGVPRSQREQLDSEFPGGVAQFIRDRIKAVFSERLLSDNYFYRVYLTGEYTPDCCPEYLKAENFQKLKDGLVDRVQPSSESLREFLTRHDGTISRYVLLDHMDWLYSNRIEELHAEWQAIVDRASSDCRMIWRSAGLHVPFVDPIEVNAGGRRTAVGDLLSYNTGLASRLHERDRVNTYGSFYIADLTVA